MDTKKELLKELLTKKSVLFYLKNNFRYQGKVLKIGDDFIELLDFKSNKIKIISIDMIGQVEYE